jgi:hypothetical protein
MKYKSQKIIILESMDRKELEISFEMIAREQDVFATQSHVTALPNGMKYSLILFYWVMVEEEGNTVTVSSNKLKQTQLPVKNIFNEKPMPEVKTEVKVTKEGQTNTYPGKLEPSKLVV